MAVSLTRPLLPVSGTYTHTHTHTHTHRVMGCKERILSALEGRRWTFFFFSFLSERRIWCWRPPEPWGGGNILKMTKYKSEGIQFSHNMEPWVAFRFQFFRLWSTFGRKSCTLLGSVLKDICTGDTTVLKT